MVLGLFRNLKERNTLQWWKMKRYIGDAHCSHPRGAMDERVGLIIQRLWVRVPPGVNGVQIQSPSNTY